MSILAGALSNHVFAQPRAHQERLLIFAAVCHRMSRTGPFRKTMETDRQPLWKCPKCNEQFVTRNMWHSCGKFTLEALFARSEPQVFGLFNRFAEMVRLCGPVTMIPQKSRVAFQVRVRFAGCYPRKSHLICAFALPRVVDDPRFFKVEKFGPHFVGHSIRVFTDADLDQDLQRWLHEAYDVGAQRHVKP